MIVLPTMSLVNCLVSSLIDIVGMALGWLTSLMVHWTKYPVCLSKNSFNVVSFGFFCVAMMDCGITIGLPFKNPPNSTMAAL